MVAQDKGNALFIGRDDALRKTVDAFAFAKQMMGDKRGHNDSSDFIRCHPLCPPRAHAKPAMVNDDTQASYASPRCDLTSAARRREHRHRRAHADEPELHQPRGANLNIVHVFQIDQDSCDERARKPSEPKRRSSEEID